MVMFNVNIYRGEWERGCRSVQLGRPCGVKVARIHLQLFTSRFWNVPVCFPKAMLRSLGCHL